MFGALGFVIAIVMILVGLCKDVADKPLPKDAYFDWDQYYADIRNGMSPEAQMRKNCKGGYYTTKPKKTKYEGQKQIAYEMYLKDKAENPERAESQREHGWYIWKFDERDED